MACRQTAWVPWLQAAATIDDCKLSSHAARALLHLESARCFPSNDTYQFDHNLYEPEMLHRCGSPHTLCVLSQYQHVHQQYKSIAHVKGGCEHKNLDPTS